ncbi:Ig-like domain-containing protein [Enterococcus sp. DIV0212c]|uniref:Ig-like domain-containing protein n=1 Tax=Enterococcus sp. DIV0212c TaxID=2230867 RepID=UPI001A9B0701|nr:Ig-like domain-containing protein [Enterococcus sp. DIV0212c]MBO1353916.1 hypothetical protein [Enterococcus sp. DIV0212c]
MYHPLVQNNSDYSIKAETSETKANEKTNLLFPSKWRASYSERTHVSQDPISDSTIVRLDNYLTEQSVSINSWGSGKLTSSNGLYFNQTKEDDYLPGMSTTRVRSIGATQDSSTTIGNYYRYRYRVKASGGSSSFQLSFYSSQLGRKFLSLKPDTWYSVKYNFKSAKASDRVFLSATRNTYELKSATVIFENIELVDITDDVLSLGMRVKDLFTDATQTKLKYSTTQSQITALKNEVAGFSDVLDNADSTVFNADLTKAQTLLDKVTTNLSAGELEDNINKTASHTISGKSFPNTFLSFSSDTRTFPEGNLISEVEDDQRNYQVQADGNGNFEYSLPEGVHFKAGETITIDGMLNGKTGQLKKIVKDTTPPQQPVFNVVNDMDGIFSGTAEAYATIKVYTDSTNTLFLSGLVGEDGNYSITIPEANKPLTPYENYYITATDKAGNISEKSIIQTVKDTTAPTADPVKQIITLGDSLADTSTLIKNLYDNAGAAQVVVELQKNPDISKVGYSIAEVLLTDRAGNHRVINIPVIVKDAQSQIDESNLLAAEDFTALAIDYPETEAEQKQFLSERSQLVAWNIITGKDIKEQIVIDKMNLEKKPGTFKIQLMIGTLKKEITVTLTAGELSFNQVPTGISYGTPLIQSKKQLIKPTNNIKLSIMDTRFDVGDWRLMAQLTHPLKTSDGHSIEDGIVYQKKETNGEWSNQTISDRFGTEVFSNKNANTGTTTVSFHDENELILTISPGSVYSGKSYSTQFIWTLENAP